MPSSLHGINEIKADFPKIEALNVEIRRLLNGAKAAGCIVAASAPKTSLDKGDR